MVFQANAANGGIDKQKGEEDDGKDKALGYLFHI